MNVYEPEGCCSCHLNHPRQLRKTCGKQGIALNTQKTEAPRNLDEIGFSFWYELLSLSWVVMMMMMMTMIIMMVFLTLIMRRSAKPRKAAEKETSRKRAGRKTLDSTLAKDRVTWAWHRFDRCWSLATIDNR